MLAATASVWGSTILAVLAVSAIAFAGIVVLVVQEDLLRRIVPVLVSFAVGALLGDALFHILPELAVDGGITEGLSWVMALSILFFFVLEKFIHLHHQLNAPEHRHVHPVVLTNLLGDGVHNFVDGAIIAGSFLVSPSLGLATTIAVALHEIPQEMGDLGVLVHAGLAPKRALAYNVASAMTALLGAVIALLLDGAIDGIERLLLAISAGAFIYIAGSDLIPELHKGTSIRTSVLQFLGIAAGFAVMAALLAIE
ncbi:MAG TPA: ZIP family metal transporter [Actinomycetota bacterium]|nr:ZIP family metal transporter [Actinomycetota bacterium]